LLIPLTAGPDLTLSTFFSLHRPISLTSGIPPHTTPEAFSSLFTNRRSQDPWSNGNSAERRPEDVIYTLHREFDVLDNPSRKAEEEVQQFEISQEPPSNSDQPIKHLDGAPRQLNIEELVAQFKPYLPPPPPQPFPEGNGQQHAMIKKGTSQRASTRGRPRKKTFTATITVTESTYADGKKEYSASSTPIIRVPEANEQPKRVNRPALSNMRRRHLAILARGEGFSHIKAFSRDLDARTRTKMPPRRALGTRRRSMLLISVKRQRKLKMKKHKYKKLMKRTRNLRRKQDRN
jgi:hypothetical protein